MMRNALGCIVPAEIVERRRKGARSRSVLLTLKRQEQKIEALFDRLPGPIAELVDQSALQGEAPKAIHQSDLSRMHFVLRAVLVQLWIRQADFGTAWNPHSLIASRGSAAQRGEKALPAEQLL